MRDPLEGSAAARPLRWPTALGVAAVAAGAVLAATEVGPVAALDQALADLGLALSPRDSSPPVLVVAIDAESLERLDDPLLFWGPHLAHAITELRGQGATAIGLDLVIEASGEEWLLDHGFADHPLSRTWDASLRRALQGGGVVLAASLQRGPGEALELRLPMPSLVAMLPGGRADLGLADLPLDPDHVARRFRPVVGRSDTDPALSLAMRLAIEDQDLSPGATGWEMGGRRIERGDDLLRIGWSAPGSIPVLPFWRLVVPGALRDADRAAIQGRVALVGMTGPRATDLFVTPLQRFRRGPAGAGLPGVFVQAHAVAGLLEGRAPAELPLGARAALLVGIGGLASLAALASRPAAAWAAVALLALASVSGAVLLAATADLVLPGAGMAFTVALVTGAAWPLRFARERRRARFVRQVLGHYVSDAVATAALDQPGGLDLGGVRREVTVLFCDLVGSTKLGEKLAPEELVELLNAWFARAATVVMEEGGIVDKFQGDGILGVFGAPAPSATHAAQGIAAGRRIAREAIAFRSWVEARHPDRGLPPFGAGVGLHTGVVIAGNIGVRRRFDYTVIGDTVNVAARVEGLTRSLGGQVMVSRATLEAAGVPVDPERVHQVQVKGRDAPVEVVPLEVSAP